MTEKIVLTKLQKEYLPAIRWLLGDMSRSGRSFLLAYACIEQAKHNLYREFTARDHCATHNADERLMYDISRILAYDNTILNYVINEKNLTFKVISLKRL